MTTDLVTTKALGGGVVQLAMDDAETRNRLSIPICEQLGRALNGLSRDPDLKVLLWTGRSDVFCAGATRETLESIVGGEYEVRELALPTQLLRFPVPIVAALEGDAVGGGLVLALCCDSVVVSASGRYGLNFTSLGFTPGMGTMMLLPAVAGHHLASEMILTGKFYKGRDLAARGLFNAALPRDSVAPAALDLCRRMAEKPRHVLELVRETLALPRLALLQSAESREHLMHMLCFSRPETREILKQAYMD